MNKYNKDAVTLFHENAQRKTQEYHDCIQTVKAIDDIYDAITWGVRHDPSINRH